MTCLDVSSNIDPSWQLAQAAVASWPGQDLYDSLHAVASESISGLTKDFKKMTGVSA